MLSFLTSSIRAFFEIFSWIVLISCIIIGIYWGKGFGNFFIESEHGQSMGIIYGIILGALVGMFFNAMWFGFIGIILNIDKGINKLNENINDLRRDIWNLNDSVKMSGKSEWKI